MSSKVSIVILAAGSSSRMKPIKQLLPWRGGNLLDHTIKVAKKSKADKIALVLGAYKEQILDQIDTHGLLVIHNEDWEAGLGASLAKGVQCLLNQSSPDGILIMLADQPLFDAAYLDDLIQGLKEEDKSIIGTRYSPTKIGVPAIFGRPYFEDLCGLEKDEGAGSIIANNFSDTYSLDPAGKEADIDSIEDYNLLYKQFGS